MNGRINGLAKVAASASLVAGVIVATAGPAFAASPNASDGAAATGVMSANPVAPASYPGTSPATVANADIAGLVTTGVVTDTADGTSASSTVSDPAIGLGALAALNAGTVTSSCSFDTNTGTVSGTADISGGAVTVVAAAAIPLDADPAPNTTVDAPGVATITLNRQTTASDGTLTVDAIYVNLVNSTQTITVGTSTCNAANLAPVPVLPGMALPIGLGALGVLGLGGLGFAAARRRRAAAVA